MEKNEVLKLNEMLYQIHACQTMDRLRETMVSQLGLVLPYTYASLMDIAADPAPCRLSFRHLICHPAEFEQAEGIWMDYAGQSPSLWLARAPETRVLRQSDVLTCQSWHQTPLYRKLYQPYDICDMLLLNLTFQGTPMALLSLFRTKDQGAFTEDDVFTAQLLSSHLNLAYHRLLSARPSSEGRENPPLRRRDLHLTRREEEILDLIFQNYNNEELLEQLTITKNTLLKHLQNIYRKCGVSSRVDLLKLRERLE